MMGMESPATQVKDILVGAGLGVFKAKGDWGINIGYHPDKPDNTITLTDTGGFIPDTQDEDKPTVQVLVRAKDYVAGWDRGSAIRDYLVAYADDSIQAFLLVSDLACIGVDETKRPEFTLNLQLSLTWITP
jgi:hypothetical protein